jgi:hypothetical protein
VHARDEFIDVERFRHVVVGAEGEAADLVLRVRNVVNRTAAMLTSSSTTSGCVRLAWGAIAPLEQLIGGGIAPLDFRDVRILARTRAGREKFRVSRSRTPVARLVDSRCGHLGGLSFLCAVFVVA